MELRDNFNIESFYQFMEENNGDDFFNIPVQCDEDPAKCAICETEDAMVEVVYERTYDDVKKRFTEHTCMGCYAHPDYLAGIRDDLIKVKLI